jgi:sulfite exporter TauE/SafE
MHSDIEVLCLTAASLGFFHTLVGPDHYLPFIAMGKARDWSWRKTAVITLLCGIGHVASSVVIGAAGIALGAAVGKVTPIETVRGEIAAWLLLVFGLLYMVWGLRRALAGKPHSHRHTHEDVSAHVHDHGHLLAAHAHVHDAPKANITPWVLFTIFVFGPCEPLIPILMYPAATHSMWGLALVTAAFSVATVSTMLAVVGFGYKGLSLVGLGRMDRYTHAFAGGSIFLCGAAIIFLGL